MGKQNTEEIMATKRCGGVQATEGRGGGHAAPGRRGCESVLEGETGLCGIWGAKGPERVSLEVASEEGSG